MTLENFRKINITLNKANQHILEPQITKVGDVNGRELVVQLIDGGVIKDQTGVSLKLNWQHANGNQGAETFSPLDASRGVFSVYYPENMLFRGTVTANISINENGKITNSLNFQIAVKGDVFDGSAVEVDGVLYTLKDLKNQLDERDDDLEVLENRQNSVESQFNAVQQEMTDKDVISAPEIIAARNGKDTLSERLNEDTENLNSRKINVQTPPIGYEKAFGDGVTDDTQAIQAIVNDFDNVYFPEGTFLLTNSIKLKRYSKITGAKNKAIITSNVEGLTLFLGNEYVIDDTSVTHGYVNGLSFKGTGKANNQIGFNHRSYHGYVNDCHFSNLGIGLKTAGVTNDYENNYFISNGIGTLISTPPTAFNTMLMFTKNTWQYNDTGVETESDENTVGLHFDHCAVEKNNGRGVNVHPFSGSFKNSWFERNGESPLINNSRMYFENNRFEVTEGYPSQKFEFKTSTYVGAWNTRGNVSIENSTISAKEIQLQRYGNYGVDNTKLHLGAWGSVDNQYLRTVDYSGEENKVNYIVQSNNIKTKKMYSIRIDEDGTAIQNDFEGTDVSATVSFNEPNNIYFVKFDKAMDVNVQVTARPASTVGNSLGQGSTVYPETIFRFNNISAYGPVLNEIGVKVFERNYSTNEVKQVKGFIDILIISE